MRICFSPGRWWPEEENAMGHSEYDPAAKERRPWNAGRMVGAKRASARPYENREHRPVPARRRRGPSHEFLGANVEELRATIGLDGLRPSRSFLGVVTDPLT